MPSNFQFTGNPKPSMYTPRGLEYFTYLPKLKAQVRGAALNKANQLVFDTTGLHQKDLENAKRMTGFIEEGRDKVVDDLIGGTAINSAVVDNLHKLSRSKMQADKNIKFAMKNAQDIQKYNDKWDKFGRDTLNFAYSERVKEESQLAWNGSFSEQGEEQYFEGYDPPTYTDPVKRGQEILAIAAGDMEPSMRRYVTANNFEVIQVPLDDGSGKTHPQMVFKGPKDLFTNDSAIGRALTQINQMFKPESKTDESDYITFMDQRNDKPEYATGVMNEIKGIAGAYEREKEVSAGYKSSNLPVGAGLTTAVPGEVPLIMNQVEDPRSKVASYSGSDPGAYAISASDNDLYNVLDYKTDPQNPTATSVNLQAYNDNRRDATEGYMGNNWNPSTMNMFMHPEGDGTGKPDPFSDNPLADRLRVVMEEKGAGGNSLGYKVAKRINANIEQYAKMYQEAAEDPEFANQEGYFYEVAEQGEAAIKRHEAKKKSNRHTRTTGNKTFVTSDLTKKYTEILTDMQEFYNTELVVKSDQKLTLEDPDFSEYYKNSYGFTDVQDSYDKIYKKAFSDASELGTMFVFDNDNKGNLVLQGSSLVGGDNTSVQVGKMSQAQLAENRKMILEGTVVAGASSDKTNTDLNMKMLGDPTRMANLLQGSELVDTPAKAAAISRMMKGSAVFTTVVGEGDKRTLRYTFVEMPKSLKNSLANTDFVAVYSNRNKDETLSIPQADHMSFLIDDMVVGQDKLFTIPAVPGKTDAAGNIISQGTPKISGTLYYGDGMSVRMKIEGGPEDGVVWSNKYLAKRGFMKPVRTAIAKKIALNPPQ